MPTYINIQKKKEKRKKKKEKRREQTEMAWLEKEKRQHTKWWVLLTNWLNQIFASTGLVLKVHLVVKVINSILLNISIIFLQQIFDSKLLIILLWNHYWNYYFFVNISNNNLLLKIYCKNIVNITFFNI